MPHGLMKVYVYSTPILAKKLLDFRLEFGSSATDR